MRTITIRTPIWKYKAIGIRKDKVTDDFQIKISYKTKNGNLLYPDTYFMTEKEIKDFPLQFMGEMFVYVIPIDKLKRRE